MRLFKLLRATHTIFVFLLLAIPLIACSREPQKPGLPSQPSTQKGIGASGTDQGKTAAAMVVSETRLLATLQDLAFTNPEAQSQPGIIFSEGGHAAAYIAGRDGALRVVFKGKAGRNYQHISHFKLSPDGNHVAHDMLRDGKRAIILDGREGKVYDDVWEPVFSPDSRHIAYIAQIGQKSYMVADDKIAIEGFPSFEDNPVFSADSGKIAYVVSGFENRSPMLIVNDLGLRQLALHEVRDGLVINRQKTKLAAVRVKGENQSVIEIGFDNPDRVKEGQPYDSIDKLAFGLDGDTVTYIARKGDAAYLVLNGKEAPLSLAEMWEPPVVRPDKKGAGLILISKGGWYFDQTYGTVPRKPKKYQEAAQLVYSSDSNHYAYCARNGKKHFVVADGKEGPVYDMVVNPSFSPDGKFLVYRARKDGKRFVVVADTTGKVIRQHPVYEQVFRPVFTSDGKSVAYGVKDGNQLIWKVEKLEK